MAAQTSFGAREDRVGRVLRKERGAPVSHRHPGHQEGEGGESEQQRLLSSAQGQLSQVFGLLGIVAAVVLLATPATATTAADGHAVSVEVAGWTSATLDNGLRVLIRAKPGTGLVASFVAVESGSVHEPPGLEGAAHFLEHLLFNGTERRTQEAIYAEADALGAYQNATTREDHTLFMMILPEEGFARGLALQADMLLHSTLPEDKFEKERAIVLEEIARAATHPWSEPRKRHRRFAFRGTPLEHDPLGTAESITAVKRDAVLRFYHERYQPSAMTLVVVGDVPGDRVLALAREAFGGGEGSTAAAALVPRPGGKAPGNLQRLQADVGESRLLLSLPLPEIASGSDVAACLEVLVTALGGGRASVIGRTLDAGGDPPAREVHLSLEARKEGWTRVEGEVVLSSPDRWKQVVEVLESALALGRRPDLLRDAWRAAARSWAAEALRLEDRIHYFGIRRGSELVSPDHETLELWADPRSALSGSGLREAGEVLWTAWSRARISVVVPVSAKQVELPSTIRLPLDPDRSVPAPAGEAERRLASGMEIAFRRSEATRMVGIHLTVAPRSAMEQPGLAGLTEMLHALYEEGSTVRDRASFEASLSSLGARWVGRDDPEIPYDDERTRREYAFVRVDVPADGWEEALRLLAEVVLHPRFDEAAVERAREGVRRSLEVHGHQPSMVAEAALREALLGSHPLARPLWGPDPAVERMGIEVLRALHEARLRRGMWILTGEGPLDPARFVEAASRLFSGLPGGEAPPATPSPVLREPSRREIEMGAGQAWIEAGQVWTLDPDAIDTARVAVRVLGDRAAYEIRERRGLAYTVRTSLEPLADRFLFHIGFGTRPETLQEGEQALREVLESTRGWSPDPEAVARIVAAWNTRVGMRLLDPLNRAAWEGWARLRRRTGLPVWAARPPRRAPDAEDVSKMLKRHLDPSTLSWVLVR